MDLSITIILVLINLYGFILMYIDKRRAINHQWRVPEMRLLLTAFCFGSLGVLSGMYIFRHKTKHWRFVVLVPISLILHLAIINSLIK
jgi:uncharacterized membrane protein YsdA (DUF1294 family)